MYHPNCIGDLPEKISFEKRSCASLFPSYTLLIFHTETSLFGTFWMLYTIVPIIYPQVPLIWARN